MNNTTLTYWLNRKKNIITELEKDLEGLKEILQKSEIQKLTQQNSEVAELIHLHNSLDDLLLELRISK